METKFNYYIHEIFNGKIVPYDEFFMLDIEKNIVETLFKQQKDLDVLRELFRAIRELFLEIEEENEDRIGNGAVLMGILVRKCYERFQGVGDSSVALMHSLCDFTDSDEFFEGLIKGIGFRLNSTKISENVKLSLLNLILVYLTGNANIHQNALIDYFNIHNEIFEVFVSLIKDEEASLVLRNVVITILVILLKYRKHETKNNYGEKLKSLKDINALKRFSSTIYENLHVWNSRMMGQYQVENSSSIFSYIHNFFTNSTSTQIGKVNQEVIQCERTIMDLNCPLLMMYELLNQNKIFLQLMARDLKSDEELIIPPLIREFLKFCSIVFSQTSSNESGKWTRFDFFSNLCLVITLSVLDNKYFLYNVLFKGDVNLEIDLFKRNNDGSGFILKMNGFGCICNVIWDVIVQFTQQHKNGNEKKGLKKAFDVLLCLTEQYIRFHAPIPAGIHVELFQTLYEMLLNGKFLKPIIEILNAILIYGDEETRVSLIYSLLQRRTEIAKNDIVENRLFKEFLLPLLQSPILPDENNSSNRSIKIITEFLKDLPPEKLKQMHHTPFLENPNFLSFFNRLIKIYIPIVVQKIQC